MATALAGLLLLVIWLMENDRDYRSVAATRLPAPVISGHALLGLGGLLVWGFYIVTDEDSLAWISLADLSVVLVLGLVMAARWVQVYRTYAAPGSLAPGAGTAGMVAVPPERHFPRPVIVIHGLLALATFALVVITVFFTGS
jgi:hypothetical protein